MQPTEAKASLYDPSGPGAEPGSGPTYDHASLHAAA